MPSSKDNSIVISAPRQGIAPSPHLGFADVRQVDVTSVPGIAQLNNISVKVSGSTITNTPNWIVRDPTTIANFFALDAAGVVYKSTDSGSTWAVLSGNSTTSAAGNGLWIWKDYLFVARNATLDTYGPISGTTFTVTIASPGVFTASLTHGLAANDTIIFTTSGALPTGLTAGTVYYVIAAGLTATDFEVSATQGGAAINTSGSQSGTHKYTAWKSTNSFKTIDSDSLWHPMITSKNDNKLYGGAGRMVYSLDEATAPFTPNVAATLTWTQQALDLPSPYRIKCIEELGNNLILGTWQGTNIYDLRVADIFPWDRSSSSFGQPVVLAEYGVHAMLNIGNSLVVLAGISGVVYRCDGSNAYQVAQLPGEITGGAYYEWLPGAICSYKNKVFFGVSNNGTGLGNIGVYSLWLTGKGNILALEHLNSSLLDGSGGVNTIKISALIPVTRNTLLVGWNNSNNAVYAIDLTSNISYSFSTSYSGFFDSPLYIVGSNQVLRKFETIEFQFAKKLATGEGIQISYRINLTDSFTALTNPDGSALTLTFATLGAVISHKFIPSIPACELTQLRVALLGTATTTPQLKTVILR